MPNRKNYVKSGIEESAMLIWAGIIVFFIGIILVGLGNELSEPYGDDPWTIIIVLGGCLMLVGIALTGVGASS